MAGTRIKVLVRGVKGGFAGSKTGAIILALLLLFVLLLLVFNPFAAVKSLYSIEELKGKYIQCKRLGDNALRRGQVFDDDDKDGAPNSCDFCPIQDNSIDADKDGMPDQCDLDPNNLKVNTCVVGWDENKVQCNTDDMEELLMELVDVVNEKVLKGDFFGAEAEFKKIISDHAKRKVGQVARYELAQLFENQVPRVEESEQEALTLDAIQIYHDFLIKSEDFKDDPDIAAKRENALRTLRQLCAGRSTDDICKKYKVTLP